MQAVNPPKVVRRVRKRLEVSQEGLARLLNATKGAVQHWERGRNNPDLARLNALRQLCPPGLERNELTALIKQTQTRLAPLAPLKPGVSKQNPTQRGRGGLPRNYPGESFVQLRRETHRLQRQVAKLEAALQRRIQQLHVLRDLATEQQREIARLRAGEASGPRVPAVHGAVPA